MQNDYTIRDTIFVNNEMVNEGKLSDTSQGNSYQKQYFTLFNPLSNGILDKFRMHQDILPPLNGFYVNRSMLPLLG